MWQTEVRIEEHITELADNDAQISDLLARQNVIVNELDKANVAQRHISELRVRTRL